MSDIKTNEEEGKKSLNFIEAMVEKDLAALHKNMEVFATYASTIPIR